MTRFEPSRQIVLLVDDNPETLTMLTEALEEAGLTVLVSRDGMSALSLLDRVQPDLILLDALMPGIDGFETCRRLKRDPRYAATPVIFMTGLSQSRDVVRGLEAGGVDYVTKPVDADALIARITVHAANARIVEEARLALDVSGRAVVALAPDGTVRWASPRGAELLGGILGLPSEITGEPLALGPEVVRWLVSAGTRPISELPPLEIDRADHIPFGPPETPLKLTYLARSMGGVHLVRVTVRDSEPPAKRLSAGLSLTAREGEVLAWLADGKSNRDIAAILEVSPRTVTKHLEQIYAKLGIENRTSAVAKALRCLGA